MKTHILFFSLIIAVMTGCSDANETAEDNSTEAAAPTSRPSETAINVESSSAMADNLNTPIPNAEAVIRNMTPGPQHKELAVSEGKWATEMKYWETDGAAPIVSKGTCEMKMVLGGRYQQSIYKGDVNGTPFEGIGYVAYDNAKKMYVNTWIDNMGTGILYLEGAYDANSHTTEMIGKCHDPATCRQKGMRQVTHNLDDNTQIMEMYETPENGKEFKSMEIKFAKK